MIDISSINTLFILLRFALDNEALSPLPSDIDWQKVVDLSFDQCIAAIAVDGLQKFYDANPGLELEIDSAAFEDLKYEWFGEVMQAEDDYQKYKSVIEFLAKILSGHNQKILLLKGYALSQVYPIPEHRSWGDIDIYQGQKGDGAFRAAGINVKAEFETDP